MAKSAKCIKPLEATVVELQRRLNVELYDSIHVVQVYLKQNNKYNGRLRAIIQTAPPELLLAQAQALDQGNPPPSLSVLPKLRTKGQYKYSSLSEHEDHGWIICASPCKANLSVVSDKLRCCWFATGGQGQSQYVEGGLDPIDYFGGHSNAGGSSSGSTIAVAADFALISAGTETSGSLSMPANRAAVFTMKPTLGLIPKDGIMPTFF